MLVPSLDRLTPSEGEVKNDAADVVNIASDSGQLAPMLEQAEELTGQRVRVTLADGGYHPAVALEAGECRGQLLVMGERYQKSCAGPYFKDQFGYDAERDSYVCPFGQRLPFRGMRRSLREEVDVHLIPDVERDALEVRI